MVRKAVPLWVARAVGVPGVVHAHSYDFVGWFDQLSPRAQALVRKALPAGRWLVLGDALAQQSPPVLRRPPLGLRREPACGRTGATSITCEVMAAGPGGALR